MSALRSRTARLLLLSVFLMPAEFVLLGSGSRAHPLPRTVLTFGTTQQTRAAGCHEDSSPSDKAPKNHDCCTLGHLHAIGSAQVSIAPVFAVTSVDNSFIPSAILDQPTSPARQISDTGPPNSAVPIRV